MFVRLGEQRIFFDVVGSKLAIDGPAMREKPTLVVLHGGPGFDHTGQRPDFDVFADIAQVIYVDHRGNGRSVPSDPATWTLDQWGDDVRALCDALSIEKPVVFGQSFGGMVAQSYATRHPDHPRAVIFSSTAARMDLAASLDLFEKKGGAEARAIAERFWTSGNDDEFATYMRVCMPLYNTRVRPGGADARARAIMRPEVYRHFSLPGCEIHRMDFRAALARVRCPGPQENDREYSDGSHQAHGNFPFYQGIIYGFPKEAGPDSPARPHRSSSTFEVFFQGNCIIPITVSKPSSSPRSPSPEIAVLCDFWRRGCL